MGRSEIVQQFQAARLAEWMGDLETAEEIYAQLEKRTEGLSRLMRPMVAERKKATHDQRIAHEKAERAQPQRLQLVDPANVNVRQVAIPEQLPQWKYSVFAVAKSDNALRLEIRGYSQNGAHPVIAEFHQVEAPLWEARHARVEPPHAEDGGDILWIDATTAQPNVHAYLSVDRWGLLSGMALAEDAQIGDVLAKIHSLVAAFSQSLNWTL